MNRTIRMCGSSGTTAARSPAQPKAEAPKDGSDPARRQSRRPARVQSRDVATTVHRKTPGAGLKRNAAGMADGMTIGVVTAAATASGNCSNHPATPQTIFTAVPLTATSIMPLASPITA